MNGEQLLENLTYVDEELVAEAAGAKRRRARWKRALAMAAAMVLVVAAGIPLISRLFRGEGSGGVIGTVVSGVYYFRGKDDGIWCYTPGDGSERLIGPLELDDWWDVNEYGLYYTSGRSLYVRPHETGAAVKLYQGSFLTRKIGTMIFLKSDGDLEICVRNWLKSEKYSVLVDGETGAMLRLPADSVSVMRDNVINHERQFRVGERVFELVPIADSYAYTLWENGEAVLPEGTVVYFGPYFCGENVILECWSGEKDVNYLLTEEGEVELPYQYSGRYRTGTTEFVFCVGEAWVLCYDVATGEEWKLQVDQTAPEFYSGETDGQYLYTCVPWTSIHACWWIEYDENGRPAALKLVSEDIQALQGE